MHNKTHTHSQTEHRVRVDVNFITVMRNYRNTRKMTRVLKRSESLMAKKFFSSTPSPVCFFSILVHLGKEFSLAILLGFVVTAAHRVPLTQNDK